MSEVPSELKYTRDHEWLRPEPGGEVVVGITDHAQGQLGELVYVELPEVGQTLTAGQSCAVVESVKAASDVFAPVSGRVTQVNMALANEPALVNRSPYAEGWLFRMQPAGEGEFASLLDAAAYGELVAGED